MTARKPTTRKKKVAAAVDRALFIGGSDAAAVLGVSPWATPVELWKEKTGRAAPRKPDPVRERMLARGKKLEPVVLDMVLDKLRERGHQVGLLAKNKRYTDPEHAFLQCEVDFELMLDGEHINGDCKTVHGFQRRKWGDEDTEDVPIEYAAQFMHGLMVTGRDRCLVAALIGLDDVQIFWVNRDQVTVDAMREKEVEFWRHCVLGDRAPDPLRFSDIKELYPLDNGRTVEATPEVAEKAEKVRRLGIQVRMLEAEQEQLRLDVAEYLGDHMRLTVGGREVLTFKAQSDRRLDERALRIAHPGLVALFERNSTFRVMRLKARR